MRACTIKPEQKELLILHNPEEQVILVEKDAHAKLITIGKVIIKITLQENASLDYYHITNETTPDIASNQHIILLGKNATASVINLFYGSNQERSTVSTVIEHEAPHTTSKLYSRGIAVQQAESKSLGLIKISKQAHHARGHQDLKTLIFQEAQAYALPELAIDNNQVQCSHSSSVGQVNKEQLFYLQSRGLTEEEAHRMIIEGFYEPILAPMPEQIQEQLRTLIKQRL